VCLETIIDHSNAGHALSPAQVDRLEGAVLALERCPDVRTVLGS
jgi:hypothetical protein